MKRFVFAVAAVALVGSIAAAQEGTVVTAPTTAAPMVVGSAVPTVTAPAPAMAQPRRGLFGRLRGRTAPAPVMAAPATTVVGSPAMITVPGTVVTPGAVVPAPMPMPSTTTPVPMPMPKPGTGAMTMPAPSSGVVLASGTMTAGEVMPAAMTTPAAESTRRGLFGRLRSR